MEVWREREVPVCREDRKRRAQSRKLRSDNTKKRRRLETGSCIYLQCNETQDGDGPHSCNIYWFVSLLLLETSANSSIRSKKEENTFVMKLRCLKAFLMLWRADQEIWSEVHEVRCLESCMHHYNYHTLYLV